MVYAVFQVQISRYHSVVKRIKICNIQLTDKKRAGVGRSEDKKRRSAEQEEGPVETGQQL